MVVAFLAAIACTQRGLRLSGSLRKSWVLLGASCGAWALGQTIWTIYETGLGREVPFPSWADAGYLAAPALGGLAGLAFALFGVAGRVLPHAPNVADPLSWAALAYIALGILLYGAALQRGAVTAVMASTTAVETIFPAMVGLALADGARAGLGPVAVLGFVMTTAATLVLVRSSRNVVPGRPDSGPDLPVPHVSPSSSQVTVPLLIS